MRALGLPFWLAGGAGSPDALSLALDAGATGIQVGTLFAYAAESGLDATLKHTVQRAAMRGDVDVFTDGRASPTGYPFKVVQLEGTNSDAALYESRERVCDLGYLRTPYRTETGRIGYRCPAEPIEDYVAKGGRREDAVGRKCLCNALLADIGMPQVRDDGVEERALVTSGDTVGDIAALLVLREDYGGSDVIEYLLSGR